MMGANCAARAVALLGLAGLLACGETPAPQTIIVRIYEAAPITQAAATATTAPALPQAAPSEDATPAPPALAACALTTLPPGQHISASGSDTQTEDEAAGYMTCRIERDSCAFGLLIRNLDAHIFFREEEPPPHNDEDRRMHPAMLMPLTRLRDLVAAEWPGEARLVVSDAYDALLEHDLNQTDPNRKYSLHFEGRSIDLLISPYDPARLERLCALAHCAGFDWVHHEYTHCHASIRAMSLCEVCSSQK